MSTTATLTVDGLQENITEAKTTTSFAAPPSVARLRTNLTEKKRQILSNISSALAHDIELKRREQATLTAQKHAPATKPVTVDTTTNANLAQQTTSPSRPALEFGRQPDSCSYRPRRPSSSSLYQNPSPSGRPCSCSIPHLRLQPHQWRSSPAEEKGRDPGVPNGGHATRRAKVMFLDDPVTEVRVFERWYQDEYVFGDKYWAKGPVRVTEDWSSVEDDEEEMRCLEGGGEGDEGLDIGSSDEEDEDGDEVLGEIGIEEIGFDEAVEEDVGKDVDGGPLVRMT